MAVLGVEFRPKNARVASTFRGRSALQQFYPPSPPGIKPAAKAGRGRAILPSKVPREGEALSSPQPRRGRPLEDPRPVPPMPLKGEPGEGFREPREASKPLPRRSGRTLEDPTPPFLRGRFPWMEGPSKPGSNRSPSPRRPVPRTRLRRRSGGVFEVLKIRSPVAGSLEAPMPLEGPGGGPSKPVASNGEPHEDPKAGPPEQAPSKPAKARRGSDGNPFPQRGRPGGNPRRPEAAPPERKAPMPIASKTDAAQWNGSPRRGKPSKGEAPKVRGEGSEPIASKPAPPGAEAPPSKVRGRPLEGRSQPRPVPETRSPKRVASRNPVPLEAGSSKVRGSPKSQGSDNADFRTLDFRRVGLRRTPSQAPFPKGSRGSPRRGKPPADRAFPNRSTRVG